MACFSHPPFLSRPLEFLDETYTAKTKRLGYRVVKMS